MPRLSIDHCECCNIVTMHLQMYEHHMIYTYELGHASEMYYVMCRHVEEDATPLDAKALFVCVKAMFQMTLIVNQRRVDEQQQNGKKNGD